MAGPTSDEQFAQGSGAVALTLSVGGACGSHSSERFFSLGRKFMGSVEIRARLTNEPLALQVLHQCIDRGARNIKCLSYNMRPGRPVLSKMRKHQAYSI